MYETHKNKTRQDTNRDTNEHATSLSCYLGPSCTGSSSYSDAAFGPGICKWASDDASIAASAACADDAGDSVAYDAAYAWACAATRDAASGGAYAATRDVASAAACAVGSLIETMSVSAVAVGAVGGAIGATRPNGIADLVAAGAGASIPLAVWHANANAARGIAFWIGHVVWVSVAGCAQRRRLSRSLHSGQLGFNREG